MAARVLLAGGDPYTVIGPNAPAPYTYPWPFYYPLPAAVIGLPFVWLPVASARIAFAGVSAFVLAYALGGTRGYIALLSGAFLQGIQHGQLAPLMLAAMLWPAMGAVVACKPNIGIAVLAGARDWRTVRLSLMGAIALGVVFLVVRPTWPLEWLAMARSATQTVPLITRAHGVGLVLLLAAWRWRLPAARVLLALAIVPATPGAMEPLLFFAFPMTFRAQLWLALLTHLPTVAVTGWMLVHGVTAVTRLHYLNLLAVAMLCLVYVPLLIGLLALRQNFRNL
jgi:hypothetical protein